MKYIPKCNLATKECVLKLKEGEHICPECDGRGGRITDVHYKNKEFSFSICILCNGKGKIDWSRYATRRPAMNKDQFRARYKRLSLKCKENHHCKTLKRIIQKEKWQFEYLQFQRKQIKARKAEWKKILKTE